MICSTICFCPAILPSFFESQFNIHLGPIYWGQVQKIPQSHWFHFVRRRDTWRSPMKISFMARERACPPALSRPRGSRSSERNGEP
jgi:hypothetical protein